MIILSYDFFSLLTTTDLSFKLVKFWLRKAGFRDQCKVLPPPQRLESSAKVFLHKSVAQALLFVVVLLLADSHILEARATVFLSVFFCHGGPCLERQDTLTQTMLMFFSLGLLIKPNLKIIHKVKMWAQVLLHPFLFLLPVSK